MLAYFAAFAVGFFIGGFVVGRFAAGALACLFYVARLRLGVRPSAAADALASELESVSGADIRARYGLFFMRAIRAEIAKDRARVAREAK